MGVDARTMENKARARDRVIRSVKIRKFLILLFLSLVQSVRFKSGNLKILKLTTVQVIPLHLVLL